MRGLWFVTRKSFGSVVVSASLPYGGKEKENGKGISVIDSSSLDDLSVDISEIGITARRCP